MCIRDSAHAAHTQITQTQNAFAVCDHDHFNAAGNGIRQVGEDCIQVVACLLYTSDAADERSSVDLGGRRIIKKKKSRSSGRRPSDKR